MQEQTCRFFAYQWLAGGVLLAAFLGGANWVLGLCGWGMCVFGCSELSARAPHFGTALVFAGGQMLLTLIKQVKLLPPNWTAIVAYTFLPILFSLMFYAFLCLGLHTQMRKASFGGKLEWTILIVLAFSCILELFLACGMLNELATGMAVALTNTVFVSGVVALAADLLRVQKRLEEP